MEGAERTAVTLALCGRARAPGGNSHEPRATRARAYLACIEQARSFDELAPFQHPEVVLVEHPNRLVAEGKTRRFSDIRLAFDAGGKAVRAQRYEVRTVAADGSTVALEVVWDDCFPPF